MTTRKKAEAETTDEEIPEDAPVHEGEAPPQPPVESTETFNEDGVETTYWPNVIETGPAEAPKEPEVVPEDDDTI